MDKKNLNEEGFGVEDVVEEKIEETFVDSNQERHSRSFLKNTIFILGAILVIGVIGFVLVMLSVQSHNDDKNRHKVEDALRAEAIKDEQREVAEPIVREKQVCSFPELNLPDDFAVFLAGGYSGRKLDFQIDQSGHVATQIDVVVNYTEKPVVIMLGAYEPTVWNISWTPNTKIIGAYGTGYHKQVFVGLNNDVPYLISTDENRGACGNFYVETDRLGGVNQFSRKLFDQDVVMVYPSNKAGYVLVGEPVPENLELVTNTKVTPEFYKNDDTELAGKMALETYVEKGVLRKADKADATRWKEALVNSDKYKELNKNVPPIAGQEQEEISKISILLINSYVALKDFTCPAGLFGGNSATFFISKGVKVMGDCGHSTIYDFDTLECRGSLCPIY